MPLVSLPMLTAAKVTTSLPVFTRPKEFRYVLAGGSHDPIFE